MSWGEFLLMLGGPICIVVGLAMWIWQEAKSDRADQAIGEAFMKRLREDKLKRKSNEK